MKKVSEKERLAFGHHNQDARKPSISLSAVHYGQRFV